MLVCETKLHWNVWEKVEVSCFILLPSYLTDQSYPFIYIYIVNKCLTNAYELPGTILGIGIMAVNNYFVHRQKTLFSLS